LVLDGDELQISAKRELACAGGLASGANKEQGDTTVRSYSTTFKLGEDIDVEKITAQLDAGVLTVQLPLVVAKQPRRIEIKAA
jgi:HSP20 family molecular chaperone IbpA